MPTIVVSMSKVPHPEFVADAMDRPIIDDARTVRCTRWTGMYHNPGPINSGSIRHKLQTDTVLERKTIVVKREQHDLIGAYVFGSVFNNHFSGYRL
jgi:hypothetical protein